MEQMKILTLENAALLVELTKGEISTASAKALKTVTIEGNTLKFYREEEPVGDSLPAYTLELPEADLSGVECSSANFSNDFMYSTKLFFNS